MGTNPSRSVRERWAQIPPGRYHLLGAISGVSGYIIIIACLSSVLSFLSCDSSFRLQVLHCLFSLARCHFMRVGYTCFGGPFCLESCLEHQVQVATLALLVIICSMPFQVYPDTLVLIACFSWSLVLESGPAPTTSIKPTSHDTTGKMPNSALAPLPRTLLQANATKNPRL